jgi:hypothetical protein
MPVYLSTSLPSPFSTRCLDLCPLTAQPACLATCLHASCSVLAVCRAQPLLSCAVGSAKALATACSPATTSGAGRKRRRQERGRVPQPSVSQESLAQTTDAPDDARGAAMRAAIVLARGAVELLADGSHRHAVMRCLPNNTG